MEAIIRSSDAPDTLTFWHGGDLDARESHVTHRSGRSEYGPGLYLTTSYGTAKSYAKGTRKLYLVVVQKGNDMADANLPEQMVHEFIMQNVVTSKRKVVMEQLKKWGRDGAISADIFNNIMVNENAVRTSNMHTLRQFYIDQGIDYAITSNIGGDGGKMMVLFNMKKIIDVTRVMPGDTIGTFDLH